MSMNRDTDLLLQSGIAAVRSGDKREGARLLAQVVRKEPQSEDAWFWLAAATDQPAEAAACLRRVLAINPNNGRARQALNMLDTGQGQAAFSTGPLETGPNPDAGNRPLSTGDLISAYSTPVEPVAAPAPVPPPPPFGASNNPYGDQPTVTTPPPPEAPPFAWGPGNGEAPTVDPYSANDPYNVNTMPSPAQSNMPPPPPFMGGGGVRLGQLDPNAPTAPINPAFSGPVVSDPGAELRASLLPTTPVNGAPYPQGANAQVKTRRGLFGRRKNVVVVPGQVVISKKKRRLNPLFLILSILIIFLAGLIGFFLMQRPANTVTEVAAADQTATAVALTATASGTPGLNGTAGAGTPGGATGTGGANPGNGTPGTNGIGGTAANGTPGANGTNGTGGTNATAGAGTVLPGQPTPTPQNGTAAPGSTTGSQTGPTATAAPGTGTGANGGEFPGSPPAGTTPGTVATGLGPDVPPATLRDNRPPPEVVTYVNKTATYINTAQFFEAAVAEGIVKPYRAGRIKPGVTLINLSPIRISSGSLNLITPLPTNGTTPVAQPTIAPNPTSIVNPTPTAGPNPTPNPLNDAGAPGPTTNGNSTPIPTAARATPAANTTPTGNTPAPGSTPLNGSNIPPEAQPFIINGPNGPELFYIVDFTGQYQMSRLTQGMGQVARVLKDSPVPAGGYELNQVALEYANDLSNMANSLDRFFQTGQVSLLEDLANYYDKAVRDRERWAQIVAAGYPFRVIL